MAKYIKTARLRELDANSSESSNGRRSRIDDYPLFLNIVDVMEITGLSKNNCYSLIKSKGCPAYKPPGQSKYLIPRDLFLKWTCDPCNKGA